jgi:lipoxygenase
MNLYHVDPSSEKRASDFYVPRDEAFSEVKQLTFSAKTLYSLFNALIPSIGNVIDDANIGFPYMTAIDSLFSEGLAMPPLTKEGFWKEVMPRLFKVIAGSGDVLRFEVPKPMESMNTFFFAFFFY